MPETEEYKEMLKKEKDAPERMHTIVLTEKNKEGELLSLDVDEVLPTFIFGEINPILMCKIKDRDKAFFIPFAKIAWFEQNYGVEADIKTAKKMHAEKLKVKKPVFSDASIV
jgi:hypothetical protein